MTSPSTCACGPVHANGCPGHFDICIAQGFVFDWAFQLVNPLTGAPQDWPVGTTARMRFGWGTGTELIVAATVDGSYLRLHLTGEETEQIPRAARITVDLNYDGDPDLWRPWKTGRVSTSCSDGDNDETTVVPVPGPPGSDGASGDGVLVHNETPGGTKNGVNLVFTLTDTPATASTAVYRNGLREYLGVGYTESGATIVFTTAPLSTDVLTVDYLIGS